MSFAGVFYSGPMKNIRPQSKFRETIIIKKNRKESSYNYIQELCSFEETLILQMKELGFRECK